MLIKSIFEVNENTSLPLLNIEDIKELEDESINVIFVLKRKGRKDFDKDLLEYKRILKKDGSIFLKFDGNFNKEELKEVKDSGLKLFQLIGVKHPNCNKESLSLTNVTDDLLWITKTKPAKIYKKQLEKQFQKEMWEIQFNNNTEYLKTICDYILFLNFKEYLKIICNNILLLNFENGIIKEDEKMIMINKKIRYNRKTINAKV